MRVDTHPDQFNVINSANDEVVKNTIKNLSRQVEWFEDMDYPIGKMVIHVGGATGGKNQHLVVLLIILKHFHMIYKLGLLLKMMIRYIQHMKHLLYVNN